MPISLLYYSYLPHIQSLDSPQNLAGKVQQNCKRSRNVRLSEISKETTRGLIEEQLLSIQVAAGLDPFASMISLDSLRTPDACY
jgi:hypothetical protein